VKILAIAFVVIGLVVFLGIYPAFKEILDATDTTGYGTVLAAFVDNMWWIAAILGVVAAASAWWILRR